MTTETTTLRERLEHLAVVRDGLALAEMSYREAFDAWLMEMGQKRDNARRQLWDEVATLETGIKDEAVAQFRATGAKGLCPGIAIKMNTVVGYSPDEALAWAQEHKIALVPEALNAKEYVNLVKSGHAPGTISKEPVAYISRDLVAALKESG